MRVVVVVPALAEGQQGDPPDVAWSRQRSRSAASPTCAWRNSPAKWRAGRTRCGRRSPTAPSASRRWRAESSRATMMRHPVPLADPDDRTCLCAGRERRRSSSRVVVMALAGEIQPMCAQKPPSRGECGSPSLVGVLMMDAMGRYPEDRPAFERQRRADRQEVFQPLRALEAAVRQQPVIAHADAEATRTPSRRTALQKSFPAEQEERSQCADMECDHEAGSNPINASVLIFRCHFSPK